MRSEEDGYAMPAIEARLKDLLDESALRHRLSSKGGYKHQSSENEHAHADETIRVREVL
jgi:hypothetical protein